MLCAPLVFDPGNRYLDQASPFPSGEHRPLGQGMEAGKAQAKGLQGKEGATKQQMRKGREGGQDGGRDDA